MHRQSSNLIHGFTGQRLVPKLLVLPMVAGLLAFAVYPSIYLVFLAASESQLGKRFQEWVWLDNVRAAFNDNVFTDSLIRSALFAIPVSLIELVLGLAIAVLLTTSLRGGHVARTLILLPLMTPPIMVATAWKLIYNPGGGLLNGWLTDLGLIDKPISYLGSSRWALPTIGFADAWQWTPFVVLLAYAALQTLPEDVAEAAMVDGATAWRTFWSISLPMIMPALVAIFLIRLIMAFKVFDLVYSLTFGGPGFDTNLATFNIWRTALRQFDVGYASAQTLIFGLLVGLITLPVVLLRDWVVKNWT
ncbi:MAG: sugar ABC transporter permease [Thermomicrobiales bacterium]|nr:sugar ABC transporter permease [Thermomicrobiales bacterium]